MLPTLARSPPSGDGWLHEVKFDGFRIQAHVDAGDVVLYSKRGADFTRRFRPLREVLAALPLRSTIIDAELVACDGDGMPCFRTLMQHGARAPLSLVCFDLLAVDGASLASLPVEERRRRLAPIVASAGSLHLQFSDAFSDPEALLDKCAQMRLEGIVSKRVGSTYSAGSTRHWIKVKTASWRAGNAWRGDVFNRQRR